MANNNYYLKIMNAGALHRIIGNCIEVFMQKNLEVTLEMKGVGSREGAKRLLSGEKCDIIALADQALFAELLVPDLVEDYFVFATDQIVIAYDHFSKGSKEINSENWADIFCICQATTDPLNAFGYQKQRRRPSERDLLILYPAKRRIYWRQQLSPGPNRTG